MEKPKPAGGRPRRRPFAAHDARAVATRARNAISWLDQLRWCMDGRPEVKSYLSSSAKKEFDVWRFNEPVMRECLARMMQALEDPIAPDEGQTDG